MSLVRRERNNERLGALVSLPARRRYIARKQARMPALPGFSEESFMSSSTTPGNNENSAVGRSLPAYCLLPTAYCFLRRIIWQLE